MLKQTLALVGLSVVTLSANAALYDRGNGMIYDDVLDITWLQDANYAQTSGFDADGRMDWVTASSWAMGLSFGGFTDWLGMGWLFLVVVVGDGELITTTNATLLYVADEVLVVVVVLVVVDCVGRVVVVSVVSNL